MKKKLFSIIMCALMVMCLMPSMAFADNNDVIRISTAEELAKIGVDNDYPLSGNYELTSDITLSGNWTPIGKGTRSGNGYTSTSTPFTGTFDGKEHTISGLTITSVAEGTSVDYALGLFGIVSDGTVKNLNLSNVNVNVSTSELSGGAVGLLVNGGTIDNVSVSGTVTATEASGGIVGRMLASGTISNCTNNATVSGTKKNVGGIVGAAYYTATDKVMTISNCTNNGAISGTKIAIGGIAGLSAANVKDCVNNGSVTGNNESVGGIVGDQYMYGTIEGCVNKGVIKNNGSGYATGGIIGWVRYPGNATNYPLSEKIIVKNNTNYGSIEGGNDGGGIIGTLYNAGEVTGNINLADSISGAKFVAGIVGNVQATETPYKTELKQAITVTGNATSTDINNIKATGDVKCVDAIAYNNPGEVEGVNITNNTIYAASIGKDDNKQGYTTLQSAVDAVKNGETIKLYEDGQKAVVKRTVSFKVDPSYTDKESGETKNYNYTITLGDNCTRKDTGNENEWNITYTAPVSKKSPNTGDNSELGIFAVAGLISAVGAALVLRRKHSM